MPRRIEGAGRLRVGRRLTVRAGSSAPLSVGELTIDAERYEVLLSGRAIELTPTEFRLLHLLMAQPGRAFARDELIARGLGDGFSGSARTLDSHMRNLRAKIEPDPRNPRYLRTVHGIGYRLSTSVH